MTPENAEVMLWVMVFSSICGLALLGIIISALWKSPGSASWLLISSSSPSGIATGVVLGTLDAARDDGPTPWEEDEARLRAKRRMPPRGFRILGEGEAFVEGECRVQHQEEHTGEWFSKERLLKVGYTEAEIAEMSSRTIQEKRRKSQG